MYYLRGFKTLGKEFWVSKDNKQKKMAYFILAVVLSFNLASVFLTVLINN